MKYIFDTSVLVDSLRKKTEINPDLLSQGGGLSIITYAELVYGVYRSAVPDKNMRLLQEMMEEMELEVLGVDERVAEIFGKERVLLERQGQRLDNFDLLIAATATVNDLVLVTGNVKHFGRIEGLKMLEA